jgi:serine/threonine protein kinase/formylglycine-generating enzyme required for sulfatase activity
MAELPADPNDRLASLALAKGLLSRQILDEALPLCRQSPPRPLVQVLLEQGKLTATQAEMLQSLADAQLEMPSASMGTLATQGVIGPPTQVRADPPATGDLQPTLNSQGIPNTLARPDTVLLPEAGGASSSANPAPVQRYRVLRSHARGGLGEVFVAIDQELQREVALKEIKSQHADNTGSRKRFLLEAEVTGRLEHPGIVPVYGLGVYPDGRPYYAMRFIRGESLSKAIQRFHETPPADPGEAGLELRRLLRHFLDVCNAIAFAHSRGVLHRDLKPDNVMLGEFGETLVVDWGLAKTGVPAQGSGGEEEQGSRPPLREGIPSLGPAPGPLTATQTQAGDVLGTPAFMSPEQASGRLDEMGPASDVYSLGATLFCLLTGKPPIESGKVVEVLDRVRQGKVLAVRQLKPELPVALEASCRKALALKPQDRYPSARELAGDLEHWLADEPVSAYPEPWRVRAARWCRRHQPLVAGGVALVITTLVALVVIYFIQTHEQGRTLREQERAARAQKERMLAQVDTLLNAAPQAVPALLASLEPFRADIRPRLRQVRQSPPPTDPHEQLLWQQHRTRAALALLGDDPSQVDFLRERLLASATSEETVLICDFLVPYQAALTPSLWQEAVRHDAAGGRRFHALVALARFDPDNPLWLRVNQTAVEGLVTAESLSVGIWSRALRPVRHLLLEPLGKVFRDATRPIEQRVASDILRDYAADQPVLLSELLIDASAQQYAQLLPHLEAYGPRAVAIVQEQCTQTGALLAAWYPPFLGEPLRHYLARRQAGAAVTLLQLQQPEQVWPLFRHTSHPEVRANLLHLLGSRGVEVRLLLARLEKETDVSERWALILSLGEYTAAQFPAAERERLVQRLLDWYEKDGDTGVHGAIDWLLRHDQEGPQPRKLAWGQRDALKAIDNRLRGQPPGSRHWYVNGQGQTLALFTGPIESVMGSPPQEEGRYTDEVIQPRRIPRSFALGTKEVTVAQFDRFLKAHPEVKHNYEPRYSPHPDGPAISVTWYEAIQYCRWLSEQEGIPENQWCYPSVAEIEKAKEGKVPLKLPADYLKRTGYRLPSEAEWEYACRASTVSSRWYGSSGELLGQHAWFVHNSQDRAWIVGQKKPSDVGLFDIHGNVMEWCQERADCHKPDPQGKPVLDSEDQQPVLVSDRRILRGGSFFNQPGDVRSACRGLYQPVLRFRSVGLRVARTHK